MTDKERRYTERGFDIYDDVDTDYGHTVRVQLSSSAEARCVWLFVGDSEITGKHSPHLTVDQAVRIRDALTAFIEDDD